ncbi:MAG: hypothetical protein M3O87_05160 [Candidatus Dormibacteraeota bacterium]|nr:hypothetical protein [Candidatus Dormibacteraeota bacterium]
MGNRALQLATLIVAVAIGVGAAFGVRAVRNVSDQQVASNSSASPSPALSPSPSPLVSVPPTPAESASPSPVASPAATSAPGRTAAAYPPQILAGSAYQYSGQGSLAALATDSQDNGTTVCAGINSSSQSIPGGDLAAYFVSVTFRDGWVLSSGYIRQGGTSQVFGQQQNTPTPVGNRESTAMSAGNHTFCVARSGGGWNMTADGATVYSTTVEPATSFAGATIAFESTIQRKDQGSGAALTFLVPGFTALAIDGQPPTQLKGSTKTF